MLPAGCHHATTSPRPHHREHAQPARRRGGRGERCRSISNARCRRMRPTATPRTRAAHPATPAGAALRLYGRRVMLRPLITTDFTAFSEVRRRNGRWLTDWEPLRPTASADPAENPDAFARRCEVRERERSSGNAYSFGIFVDSIFVGEVNLNGVTRGSMQSATIGYWIDKAKAGQGYVPESVAVITRFAFEELRLHRLEICIIPRNNNSLRV
ncbi:MAG: N-acetyltransferase, partial [Actinobacteria bacterium]|nr:N-acetyltransferase [Actinomycetota bacterium]